MLNKLLQNRLDKKSKPYYNLNKLFALQAKKQTEQANQRPGLTAAETLTSAGQRTSAGVFYFKENLYAKP